MITHNNCVFQPYNTRYPKDPDGEVYEDFARFAQAPRRPLVVKSDTTAPQLSALEMGKVNESFRVFVRIRPGLAREKGIESCCEVEDVKNFPRDPKPQRIRVHQKMASLSNVIQEEDDKTKKSPRPTDKFFPSMLSA